MLRQIIFFSCLLLAGEALAADAEPKAAIPPVTSAPVASNDPSKQVAAPFPPAPRNPCERSSAGKMQIDGVDVDEQKCVEAFMQQLIQQQAAAAVQQQIVQAQISAKITMMQNDLKAAQDQAKAQADHIATLNGQINDLKNPKK